MAAKRKGPLTEWTVGTKDWCEECGAMTATDAYGYCLCWSR